MFAASVGCLSRGLHRERHACSASSTGFCQIQRCIHQLDAGRHRYKRAWPSCPVILDILTFSACLCPFRGYITKIPLVSSCLCALQYIVMYWSMCNIIERLSTEDEVELSSLDPRLDYQVRVYPVSNDLVGAASPAFPIGNIDNPIRA